MLPPQAAAGYGAMPPEAYAGYGGLPPQAAAGVSPDGLGATIRQPFPQSPTTPHYHLQELGYELPVEPKDTSSSAAVQSAGFTALLAALGIGVGVAVGGAWGAGSGLLLVGGIANGYRAQKWMSEEDPGKRHEAVVSATLAVGEVLVGAWMGYKAYKAKKK
jgi:hypothetical protein